ncbi:ABC transporter permease [Brevibacillus sp. AY1]|nr:ABC transporter permease [Brevibacillus sp. AY1]
MPSANRLQKAFYVIFTAERVRLSSGSHTTRKRLVRPANASGLWQTVNYWKIQTVTLFLIRLNPMSGMVIGTSMIVCGLYISQMNRETETARGEIEALLALGATSRQAIQGTLRRAVKASMIPTFDTMKTIGLVQLPGMMTGMIIAGASPIEAVRYQILTMLTFSSAAAISSVMISLLSYQLWFTSDSMLRQEAE